MSQSRPLLLSVVAAIGLLNVGVAAAVGPIPSGDEDTDSAADTAPAESGAGTPAPGQEPASPSAYLIDAQIVEEDDDAAWAVGSSLDNATALPLFERDDEETWHLTGSALTDPPEWAGTGPFSPAVIQDGELWWLFFAAQSADTGRVCLGAATAAEPLDGFEPAAEPVACAAGRDLIDPSPYRTDDGVVLTWSERSLVDPKNGGQRRERWRIRSAELRLDPDDPSVGKDHVLLSAGARKAGGWEGGIIDSPALLDIDGQLVLLYGGNEWGSADYAPGYAVCPGPTQRCDRRTVESPLAIPTGDQDPDVAGVAGLQPIVSADAGDAVVLHGLSIDPATGQATGSTAFRAELSWSGGALVVDPPDSLDVTTQ